MLLTLFAWAAVWQKSWTAEVRAERDESWSADTRADTARPDLRSGWSRVIVGRPSGAEPLDAPPRSTMASVPNELRKELPKATPTGETNVTPLIQEREFELVVQRGQSLSKIAQAHYHSSRNDMLQALTAYNKLKDPGSLREGERILLPPIEKLLPKNH